MDIRHLRRSKPADRYSVRIYFPAVGGVKIFVPALTVLTGACCLIYVVIPQLCDAHTGKTIALQA